MVGSKLMELLETCSKNERNELRKFIAAPFFNDNSLSGKLLQLFEQAMDESETARAALLDKHRIWKQLFPKKRYKDVLLRRMVSDLTQSTFQFLAYRQFTANPLTTNYFLLQALQAPSLDKHYQGVLRQIENLKERSGLRNAQFHYQNFLLEYKQHERLEASGKKLTNLQNLEKADFHLDCFYITQKLKNYCDSLGYRKTISSESRIELPNGFLNRLEHSPFMEEHSVRAYYLITQMMLKPEEETHYHKAKQVLYRDSERFNKKELQNLFTHLINYCIDTKINVGRSAFFTELFELYKTALEKEIILEKDQLGHNHYNNLITVGLHVKEFDWVEQFIQTYTSKLPEPHQENVLTYNLAKVYFHQHHYEKVIEQLREVEYKSITYALGGKLMLLKTYYELGEYLPLDSLLDSFRIYLQRNRLISKDVKQQYLNVLRFVRRLSSLAPRDKKGLEKIKMQIQECKALADKEWILEKVAELE